MNRAVLSIISVLSIFIVLGFTLYFTELTAQGYSRISAECLDCHEDALKGLLGTTHQIQIEDKDARVACTDCHMWDDRHPDDPEKYPLTNPARTGVWIEAQICRTCHVNSHQQTMHEVNVHAASDINCSGCHKIHDNKHPRLLKNEEVQLCLSCHSNVRGEFERSFRHPVLEGAMKCSECHMNLDEHRSPIRYAGASAVCFTCHNEFQGPFPFEHQATVDYSTEEGGCLNCHAPHGSHVARMLKQNYESPSFALCSQCHSVPKHSFNSFHGTQWAGKPCADCHVDIHGSYLNRNFLTPALQSQGCFNAGCHQL